MSLISLIARSSSVGTKYGPPQCRSEMWAILNAPLSTPDMRGSVETDGLVSVQAVDGAELLAQIAEQRLRVEASAHHALEQLGGHELAAVPVHVLTQPLAQRGELAGPDLVVEIRQLAPDPLPELARDDVAEGVGREIADRPSRPVHVLKHAVGDVGDVDSEV